MPARKDEQPSTGGTKARLRKRLWLAFSVTILMLGLAEVGLRVVGALTHRARGIDYHAEYGWKMIPNVEKVGFLWGGDAVTRVNSQGWRDDEFSVEADADRQRIVVAGDSFTFGVGLNHGERFTEQLETASLEVLNFGVNSSGTDQQLRYLEQEALAYRPSIVVLVTFLGNDLEDIRFERKRSWPKPYYELEAGELRLVPPEPSLWLYARTHSYLAELVGQFVDKYNQRQIVAPSWRARDTVPLYLALAARARDVAEAAGAKFLVALVYPLHLDAGGRTAREEAVRAGLHAARIETLDTFEMFRTRRAAGEQLHLTDGHWNPAGNAVFAAALRERMRRLGWIRK